MTGLFFKTSSCERKNGGKLRISIPRRVECAVILHNCGEERRAPLRLIESGLSKRPRRKQRRQLSPRLPLHFPSIFSPPSPPPPSPLPLVLRRHPNLCVMKIITGCALPVGFSLPPHPAPHLTLADHPASPARPLARPLQSISLRAQR